MVYFLRFIRFTLNLIIWCLLSVGIGCEWVAKTLVPTQKLLTKKIEGGK